MTSNGATLRAVSGTHVLLLVGGLLAGGAAALLTPTDYTWPILALVMTILAVVQLTRRDD